MKHLQNVSKEALDEILYTPDIKLGEPNWYVEPSVLKISDDEVVYNYRKKLLKQFVFDKEDYLSIYVLTDGTFTYSDTRSASIEYKFNDGQWTTYSEEVACESGDIIKLRGNNTCYNGNRISCSGYFMLYGNTDSLINSDATNEFYVSSYTASVFRSLFSNNDTLLSIKYLTINATSQYCCYGMFQNCSRLIDVLDLLPKPTSTYAFAYMFERCSNIEDASNLTINPSGNYCCSGMFGNCVSLRNIPILNYSSSTTGSNLFNSMFSFCTSLVNVNSTIQLTAATSQCTSMFAHCTNLIRIPKIVGDPGNYACREMFAWCSSLKVVPLESMISIVSNNLYRSYAFRGMFQGCSNLKVVEALPQCGVYDYTYAYMFDNCVNLEYAAPIRSYNIESSTGVTHMFRNCYKLQAYKIYLDTSSRSLDYMFTNCKSLQYIEYWGKIKDTIGSDWLSGVSNLGGFTCLYPVDNIIRSSSSIPKAWTVDLIPLSGDYNMDYYAPFSTVDLTSGESVFNYLDSLFDESVTDLVVTNESGNTKMIYAALNNYGLGGIIKNITDSTSSFSVFNIHGGQWNSICSKTIDDGVETYNLTESYPITNELIPVAFCFRNWKNPFDYYYKTNYIN